MSLLKKEKSLAELEEETERLEVENKKAGLEFSLAEKRAMAARLKKEYGLTPAHFSADFGRIFKWLKEH